MSKTRNLWRAVSLVTLLAATVSAQAPADSASKQPPAPVMQEPERGDSYYHFTMGAMYEQLYEQSYESPSRSSYARQAIEHYKKAYALDPRSDVIGERLAEMYAKSQRIRDAVLEAQEILKRDPNSVGARRLLGRIYVRTLGEADPQRGQPETLALAIEQYKEIVRLDPEDPEAYLWLARLCGMQNRHDEAEKTLRSLLAVHPGHTQGLQFLAQLLLDAGRGRDAIALLKDEAESADAGAHMVALLAEAYAQLNDLERAEQAYRRASQLEPSEPAYRQRLARTLSDRGKSDEAIEQYRKLVDANPRDAESFLRLAQEFRKQGKLEEAEQHVTQARQLAPGSLEVIYNEALIYESQGRFDDAIRVLTGAAASLRGRGTVSESRRRSLGIVYNQLGRLYREVQNFSAAIAVYEEMRALGPEEASQARSMLIESYRAGGQLDRAIAESEQALAAEPDRGNKMVHALLLAERGEADQAVQLLRGLLDNSAADRDVHLTIAQVYERTRRYAEAETAAHRAEQLSQDAAEKEVAWFLLGAIYERWHKYDQAEQQFKKVLEANARHSGALNYYGYMLAERGHRLEEAVSLIQRALAEEPHNGAYLDSLGWAYYKLGRYHDAEEQLRRAAERSSNDPTIREHLGDAYAKLGRFEEAHQQWDKALAEWKRSSPAEYEPEKVAAVEKKLRESKSRLAQQKPVESKQE
jgi:tetratricopeptide (TPR) repeat protein